MPKQYSNLLTKSDVTKFSETAKTGQYKLDGNGLYLRKNKNSTIYSLRFSYKRAEGIRNSWFVIGDTTTMTLATARTKTNEYRKLVAKNINIHNYRDCSNNLGKTFGEILSYYVRDKKSRLASTSLRRFNTVMSNVAKWNQAIMEQITEVDIAEIIKKIKIKAPSIAAALLRELKSIYEYAYDENYILKKHEFKVKAKFKVTPRSRFLTENKLGVLFRNLWDDKKVPYTIQVAVYALFILMLRREELLNIEWSDIDFNTNKLIVKKTKAITNFSITLPAQLVDKLKTLQQITGDKKYVFAYYRSHYSGNVLCNYCKKIGKSYGIDEFTPHDARRTAMTVLSDRNHNYKVIDMALGHVPLGVHKHYLKTNMGAERAKLLQDYADLIDLLVSY